MLMKYEFPHIEGDLFHPEEIFQLDQPLRPPPPQRHSSPHTILELGSGSEMATVPQSGASPVGGAFAFGEDHTTCSEDSNSTASSLVPFGMQPSMMPQPQPVEFYGSTRPYSMEPVKDSTWTSHSKLVEDDPSRLKAWGFDFVDPNMQTEVNSHQGQAHVSPEHWQNYDSCSTYHKYVMNSEFNNNVSNPMDFQPNPYSTSTDKSVDADLSQCSMDDRTHKIYSL